MAISQGSKIAASDLSGVLTTSNFLSSIDLDALKTALNISDSSKGAKIVGSTKSISGKVITLTTTDWDYAHIISYPPSIVRTDASISVNDYYGYGMEDAPVESIVFNNNSAYIPIWVSSSYLLVQYDTITASKNTLTLTTNNATSGRFSITLYKNS